MIAANDIALKALAKAEVKIPPQPRRQGPPPPPQHGTVDPYAGNTVCSGAVRGARPGMGVYRARAGQWEEFKDAQVKPIEELQDDKANH